MTGRRPSERRALCHGADQYPAVPVGGGRIGHRCVRVATASHEPAARHGASGQAYPPPSGDQTTTRNRADALVTARSPLPSSLRVIRVPTRPSRPANASTVTRNGPTLPLAANMQW